MSYQFTRIELFSRKGKNGRNTDFILDEVSREPHACLHVSQPEKPTIIFGEDISQLRALHDNRADAARTVTSKGKIRRIRGDQNTLAGVILSHPSTIEDYRNCTETKSDVGTWEACSIDWLNAQYGDQLITIVRHVDESHPHLHAYILPNNPEMKAADVHPGFVAKKKVLNSERLPGEDSKMHKKRADRAYVEAMRYWLDDYHKNVAIPSGQTRLGPRKRRLRRAEWQREKVQASALRETVKRAKAVRSETTKMVYLAQKATRETDLKTSKAEERQRQLMRNAKIIAEARDKSIQELKAAEELAKRLQRTGGQIRAVIDGFQTSRIAQSVANNFQKKIESMHNALKQAQQELIDERKRRRETEEKLVATSASTRELAVARDNAARKLLALQEKIEPSHLGRTVDYPLIRKEYRL